MHLAGRFIPWLRVKSQPEALSLNRLLVTNAHRSLGKIDKHIENQNTTVKAEQEKQSYKNRLVEDKNSARFK